jgi:cell division protein FtsN
MAGSGTNGNSKTTFFVIGMVVGLLLGIVISLGVALYINRAASPFSDKQRATEVAKAPGKPEAKPDTKTDPKAAAGTDAAKKEERPRFEFYQILPGDRAATPGAQAEQAKSDATKESKVAARDDKAKPAPTPTKEEPRKDGVKPAVDERVFVQAGAFPNESDADNLKGRIAFIGLEASVVRAELGDKGTWFRVRIGPYKSTEDATRAKDTLSANGISATLVK